MVPHRPRGPVSSRYPVEITLRLLPGLPSLREAATYKALEATLRKAHGRFGMRIIHYCVQPNHIHLIVEIDRPQSFERAMRGLTTRIAMTLCKHWGKPGRKLEGRYHSRPLKTPREVHSALHYCLNNGRHHAAQRGKQLARGWMDPMSSARAFDGWQEHPERHEEDSPWGRPETWLLKTGWKRHGLLSIDDVPGPAKRKFSKKRAA